MALQINGTTVVNNSRQLQNIASVDATTAAVIAANAGGTDYELPPYENNSTNRDVEPFIRYYSNVFSSAGFEATGAYSAYGDNTKDNLVICRSFGGTGGSNQWLSVSNSAGSSKKIEIFSITNLTTQLDSNTVKTGPDSDGFYKYVRTVPANTAAFAAWVWFEPSVVVYDVSIRWQAGINLYTRSGSGRTNSFVGLQRWFQGDVGF
jgi:hypothetical protein